MRRDTYQFGDVSGRSKTKTAALLAGMVQGVEQTSVVGRVRWVCWVYGKNCCCLWCRCAGVADLVKSGAAELG